MRWSVRALWSESDGEGENAWLPLHVSFLLGPGICHEMFL